MINNLGTPSSELQINFGVLQIKTENSATGDANMLQKIKTAKFYNSKIYELTDNGNYQNLMQYTNKMKCNYLINLIFIGCIKFILLLMNIFYFI